MAIEAMNLKPRSRCISTGVRGKNQVGFAHGAVPQQGLIADISFESETFPWAKFATFSICIASRRAAISVCRPDNQAAEMLARLRP